MKITDIKAQVKRAGCYSIYVDGKYSFSLSESELLSLRLHIGQEFTKNQLNDLLKEAAENKTYMRALNLLARRPRSEWEMRDYLKRKGYEPELINKIVNKLIVNKLINDEKFARFWVENRRLLKPVSKRRLLQELQQKHISHVIITTVLNDDITDERAVLRELVEKKRLIPRYKQNPQKLMAYLIRQGFCYDDVKAVLDKEE